MFVFVNDQRYTIDTALSLSTLFDTLNIEVTKGIAVAVNDRVIPKTGWSSHMLDNEDKIILIKATQGG